MRILLLSYCFPPVPLIESQVTAKVTGHLDAEVDVIAADAGMWRLASDHSLDDYVAGAFASVTRVSAPHMPLLLTAQNRLPLLAERPDALTFLNGQVLRELRRRRLSDYDLLVTRGQFHSIHLVGLALRDRPPWVAHFSDPWVGNRTRGNHPRVRWINERNEAKVIRDADCLVFTSSNAAEFTMARYEGRTREKVRHVPHCFVPELFDASHDPIRRDGPIVARHVGHLRWNRHPEPLFRALLAMESLRRGSLEQLRVDLLGLVSTTMLKTPAARQLPDGLVSVSPPVDYRTSLDAMRAADLLLVTEIEAERSVDLHAKIVDYTGAGVPIVGITPPGPTADLIRALGGWHAIPAQPEDGARALLAGIDEAQRRRSRPTFEPWGDPAVRERYSAARVAHRLGEIYRDSIPSRIATDRAPSAA